MHNRLFFSFTIHILFAVFILAGVALVPLIPVQLKPDYTTHNVLVQYLWSAASRHRAGVTLPLESWIATMRGIKMDKQRFALGQMDVNIHIMQLNRKEMPLSDMSTIYINIGNSIIICCI